MGCPVECCTVGCDVGGHNQIRPDAFRDIDIVDIQMVCPVVINSRFGAEGEADGLVIVCVRKNNVDSRGDFGKAVISPTLGAIVVPQRQKIPCGSVVVADQYSKAIVVQARGGRMVVFQT